jgi:hypothetical protein
MLFDTGMTAATRVRLSLSTRAVMRSRTLCVESSVVGLCTWWTKGTRAIAAAMLPTKADRGVCVWMSK